MVFVQGDGGGRRLTVQPGEERLLSMFGSAPSEARRCNAQVVRSGVKGILAARGCGSSALWDGLLEVDRSVLPLVFD